MENSHSKRLCRSFYPSQFPFVRGGADAGASSFTDISVVQLLSPGGGLIEAGLRSAREQHFCFRELICRTIFAYAITTHHRKSFA